MAVRKIDLMHQMFGTAGCILSGIGYGLLLFAGKIKGASRKRKLNKRIYAEGGGEDADK